MRCVELRSELKKRSLSDKGRKAILIERLESSIRQQNLETAETIQNLETAKTLRPQKRHGSTFRSALPYKICTSYYVVKEELGRGGGAAVFRAASRKTQNEFALKKFFNGMDSESELLHEISMMNKLSHPRFVRLIEAFQDGKNVVIIQELIRGGELFTRLEKLSNYTENDARECIKKLLEGMQFMHSANIAHIDLKPENILLKSEDNHTDIKIADLGEAQFVPKSGLSGLHGSPPYMAPEVVHPEKRFGLKADMWSIGVVTFILLSGYMPFDADTQQELFDRILECDCVFTEIWDDVSPDAKDFVQKLLCIDPAKRLSCEEALVR